MKRYILFLGESFYPLGGMLDIKGHFDSIPEAIEFAKSMAIVENFYEPWFNILDMESEIPIIIAEGIRPEMEINEGTWELNFNTKNLKD